jgi:PTS system fructose-specific IIC component
MKNMESLIAPQSILFPLDTDDRSTAFEAMVEALVKDGKLPPDLRDLTLDALENRESRLTTAIGNHIALPHASVAGLPGVVTCVAGTTRGIDCQAPDKQPTRIFLHGPDTLRPVFHPFACHRGGHAIFPAGRNRR